MDVRVDTDERFPYYSLVDEHSGQGAELKVNAIKVRRWQRVMDEFEVVQNEMKEALQNG